jgi:hypothetical protein
MTGVFASELKLCQGFCKFWPNTEMRMRRVDNQVKFCFVTAGEMYYDEVRKEKPEEEKHYCKLDTERFYKSRFQL